MRHRVAAGAFVMNIQRKRRHRSRKRHDSDRDPVIQTSNTSTSDIAERQLIVTLEFNVRKRRT